MNTPGKETNVPTIDPAWQDLLTGNNTHGVPHVNYARFVAESSGGTLRYSPEVGWLGWSGKVWERQPDEAPVLQAMTDAAKTLFRAFTEPGGHSWYQEAGNVLLRTNHRTYIARELRGMRGVRARLDEFDTHPHLLTFQNGTVDLRTGDMTAHDPQHLLTQITNVDYVPDAEMPEFDKFLRSTHPEDNGVREYLRTLIGYGITGENREHAFAIWYGQHGRNGKGSLIRALKAAFGPNLIMDTEFSVFEKGSAAHTEAIARLKSARIVTASEGSEGVPLDAEMLKRHAGGDAITARHLHGAVFEYVPQYLIVLLSNHLPEFRTSGAALWSRVRAVEFTQSFADNPDRTLDAKLRDELEGIAAWAVRGAIDYYAQGLISPEAVEATTRDHKEKVNPLAEMIGDLFEFDADAKTKRADFNRELKEWKVNNGYPTAKFQPSWVKVRLSESGVEERNHRGTWYYTGVRLTPEYGGPVKVPDSLAGIDSASRDVFGQGR